MKKRSETYRLIVSVMMAGLLLAACSAPSPSSTGTTETAGKPNGSLVSNSSVVIATLDPAIGTQSATYQVWSAAVLDSLVTLDTNGNVAPQLAERWEISDDGLTHTFYLRKGVKFHDGSPFTAADVKFSMDRLLSPEATSVVLTAITTWKTMAPQVEVKDDYTVVVKYKTPQFGLPKSIIDGNGGPPVVLPKKYIEEKGIDNWRKNPVGTGAWKVVNYLLGQRVELEANEDYWDANFVPKFKNLTFIQVGEEGTKVAMLKTGELDIADISPESVAALKTAGLKIKSWSGGQQAIYPLFYDLKNPSASPFSDLKVRKATSLAINRQEMADKLFMGYAEPGILPRVQRTFDFFDATQLKADPYDPEGAKKLLAEAGYPNGFTTKVWDQGAGGILSTFNQALGGYWTKVGINAPVEKIEQTMGVQMQSALRSGTPDARIWTTTIPTGIGTSVFPSAVGFDIGSIFHGATGAWRNQSNQKLDELIDKYPLTKDPAQRKAIAREATILAKNEYSAVAVLDVMAVWALGSKIGDVTPIQGRGPLGASYATLTHSK